MSNLHKLDKILRNQASNVSVHKTADPYLYARSIAEIENVIAVVSDLSNCHSRIFTGGFANALGLQNYTSEDSIWEKNIISLMSEQEQEEKIKAELRFYHFLRHISKAKRNEYYLLSKLRFTLPDGKVINVMHKMYYIYDSEKDNIIYAICLYGPMIFDICGKSMVVNSITGITEELTSTADNKILSKRELQVLSLIDTGMKSTDIADILNISINTVNRHRQEILSKLQVKNSHEACRIAKSLNMI
ncbi:MAG: LuxR C-terminal-related transcriptional regulator [Paramuribaculum sp.]|nr:LuxR C-terminal-related transcriptional regulator [Paramuribaculum sp.]